jgi:hypothetical protein
MRLTMVMGWMWLVGRPARRVVYHGTNLTTRMPRKWRQPVGQKGKYMLVCNLTYGASYCRHQS